MSIVNGSNYMPLASTDNDESTDDDNDQINKANRMPTTPKSTRSTTLLSPSSKKPSTMISSSATTASTATATIQTDSPTSTTSTRSASTSPDSDSPDWTLNLHRQSDFNRNNILKKNRVRDFRKIDRIKFGNYSGNSVRLMKKKFCIGVLAIIIFILFLMSNENEDRIAVMHYSHVPGMKAYETISPNDSSSMANQIIENGMPLISINASTGDPPIGDQYITTQSQSLAQPQPQQKQTISTITQHNSLPQITSSTLMPNQSPNPMTLTMIIQQNQINNLTNSTIVSNKLLNITTESINSSSSYSYSIPSNQKITTTSTMTMTMTMTTINANHNSTGTNIIDGEKIKTTKTTTTSSSSKSSSSIHLASGKNNNNNNNTYEITNEILSNGIHNGDGKNSEILTSKGYLVWSDSCKIPNLDPYLPEVMQHFKRQKYTPCSSVPPLTRIDFDDTTKQYVIQIIDDNISLYSKWGTLDCCYQSVERNFTDADADLKVSFSTCIAFKKQTKLSSSVDNVLVTCKVKGKQVYKNGYAMMPERKEIYERLSKFELTNDKAIDRVPNVLLIGIDSIARTHLIRAMPKTAQYLYDNEWFEMAGYNKIADNTFPNLMAVLTGRNLTDVYETCKPTVVGSLDKCDIIWKAFKEHGYVTAYAEDDILINTFNFLKKGFVQPPTDYYIRPFFLMGEHQLRVRYKSGLVGCVGYEHAAQHVFNYAFELRRRYKNIPHFGLFWMNSFSHNSLSDCSSMDDKILEDLQQLSKLGVLNDSVVIFFSDHGMRFGPARKTFSGRLEERLPFLFIWVPPFMKHSHPEIVSALSVNKNRLINPYDLHMTIKDILEMTGRVKDFDYVSQAMGCSRCQTLFRPVPHNRSCDEINIDDHWCTCTTFESVYKESKIVHKLVNFTLEHINNLVYTFDNGKYATICIPLKLDTITEAFRAQHFKLDPHDDASQEIYRILFRTSPNKGLFEATIRYNTKKQTMVMTGEVSRLNSYAQDSKCIDDNIAKKYCVCRTQ